MVKSYEDKLSKLRGATCKFGLYNQLPVGILKSFEDILSKLRGATCKYGSIIS